MFDQPTVEMPTDFFAGLLSFISPDVLALIPEHRSLILGMSMEGISLGTIPIFKQSNR